MRTWRLLLASIIAVWITPLFAEDPQPEESMERGVCIVVQGAAGEPQYGEMFSQWSKRWIDFAQRADMELILVGVDAPPNDVDSDRSLLLRALEQLPREGNLPVWLVFNGHGTYSPLGDKGGIANFNLQGPDISATEFAEAIKPFVRPLVIVQCASCSGPFLAELSAANRVVVTATRSGEESNFARFGEFMSVAIGDPNSDLDHDEQVSILEAFLKASTDTKQFYQQQGRLQTEHPLIDDNGDKQGTSADFFRGVRPVAKATNDQALDGILARRLTLSTDRVHRENPVNSPRIAEILDSLEKLRLQKEAMEENEYFVHFEHLLIELIQLERSSPTAP
jgi:hypothetical protein